MLNYHLLRMCDMSFPSHLPWNWWRIQIMILTVYFSVSSCYFSCLGPIILFHCFLRTFSVCLALEVITKPVIKDLFWLVKIRFARVQIFFCIWSHTQFIRGTWWRSWLRHCAPSRKVAGSIPDGVIGIFHWHNPSGRTMALGLTQPLTEVSTRNISWE